MECGRHEAICRHKIVGRFRGLDDTIRGMVFIRVRVPGMLLNPPPPHTKQKNETLYGVRHMTSDLLPVLASATTVVTDPICDLHGQAHGFAVFGSI